MANFDSLYTGNTGLVSTFGNEETSEVQDEIVSEQQRRIAELTATATDELAALDEEIKAVGDIRAYIKTLGANPSENAIKDEYRARELYIGYLNRRKQYLSGIAPQEQTI